ncbi:MAG: ATP synthase F1 subunit epsilon [Candidatus Palauibacterales bacterium]|nr:ATP synthase F1 subunit epsilon [Candidatus Palauibacterales bacterium]MDP2483932.1 ATP synthase F1 subunit epsilon [Candidatus Palauibacterales bacterium]
MGDSTRKLKVAVISPTEVGFEGEGESVVVPAYDGLLGILYGHAPLMTLLGTGEVTVTDGETVHRIAVSGGFLQIVDNEVSVLARRVGECSSEGSGTKDAV